MIDTDKYEGHTPAPWVCGSEEGLGIWKGLFNGVCATPDNYGKKGYEERPIARMHITEGTAESDFNRMMGDKQLIADAPLLLAEVKRLSAEVRRLRNIICLLEDSRIRSLSVTDRPQLFTDILEVFNQRNEDENGHLPDFEEVIE